MNDAWISSVTVGRIQAIYRQFEQIVQRLIGGLFVVLGVRMAIRA